MITLINFKKTPINIEYVFGNKVFYKQILPNFNVGFKHLKKSTQITNLSALKSQGVTIYNYDLNTYVYKNPKTPTGNTLSYMFVGDNVKPNQYVKFNDGFTGTTSSSGMTFTATDSPVSTVYTFITSANTAMANGTISATTVGNSFLVSFSGSSLTTTNWYNAVSSLTNAKLITITGYNSTLIKSAGTTTFFLSASTAAIRSGFAKLNSLI